MSIFSSSKSEVRRLKDIVRADDARAELERRQDLAREEARAKQAAQAREAAEREKAATIADLRRDLERHRIETKRARAELDGLLVKASRALATVEKAEAARDATATLLVQHGEAVRSTPRPPLKGEGLAALADFLASYSTASREAEAAARRRDDVEAALAPIAGLRAFTR